MKRNLMQCCIAQASVKGFCALQDDIPRLPGGSLDSQRFYFTMGSYGPGWAGPGQGWPGSGGTRSSAHELETASGLKKLRDTRRLRASRPQRLRNSRLRDSKHSRGHNSKGSGARDCRLGLQRPRRRKDSRLKRPKDSRLRDPRNLSQKTWAFWNCSGPIVGYGLSLCPMWFERAWCANSLIV